MSHDFVDNTHNHYRSNGNLIDLVIPNYSRITQQFQQRRFRKRAQFWFKDGEQLPVEEVEEGVFRFDKTHPRYVTGNDLVKWFSGPNGYELVVWGVQFEKDTRKKVDLAIRIVEKAIQENKIHLIEVIPFIDTASDYAALFFNNLYPEDLLRRQVLLCFPSDSCNLAEEAVKAILMPTSKSNFHYETHLRLVREAQRTASGQAADIKDFMDRFGFYEDHDLRPGRLEQQSIIQGNISSLVKEGKAAYEIERDRIYEAVLVSRINKERVIKDLFQRANAVPSVNSQLLTALCKYANSMLEYDDLNRRMRTRTYKVFRGMLNHYGLDLQKTSIEELAERILNDRKQKGVSHAN